MKKLLISAAACLAAFTAQAGELPSVDGYPERAVTFVSPYKPGGGSDGVTRATAKAMEEATGTKTIVVNKPGGAGVPGTMDFLAQRPDGHNVLQGYDAVISNFLLKTSPINPVEDIEPLGIVHITFNQLLIRPDETRFSDFATLVEHIRAHPGQVKFANIGDPGSMERIMMAKLEEALDIETVQVPYPAPAERYAALIGGHVDVLFEQAGDVATLVEAGEMKPIFSFVEEAPGMFADLPTLKTVGADFKPLYRFRGFWVDPRVDAERKAWLETAIRKAFEQPSMQAYNKAKYMDLMDSYRDSEGAAQLLRDALDTYRAAYKELGLID
ncbi:tripartite tricarboxylate transporter substrate binding protein [Geminicoccaceae bacterium 1502E]|nr:tripartite tricarboxylate transporter substrate binding protein [Geminicoccaceae bacterium 1502E]